MTSPAADRVGLGWRPELASGILSSLDRIDLVEVLADDWLALPRRRLSPLRTLAAQVPVTLHGVSLGLASAEGVEPARLGLWARLVETVRPASWSEHLAFVRAGGVEIGHLAAPPRTRQNIETTSRNIQAAARAVGALPYAENVATLVEPPGSELSEADWLAAIVESSGAPFLLDLHNLHANATNFGFDAVDALDRLPADRIAAVHLAGGKKVGPKGRERVLDDHLHAIPEAVYALLEEIGARAPGPLDVVLERDGRFPPIEELLGELDRARAALARGRARRAARAAA